MKGWYACKDPVTGKIHAAMDDYSSGKKVRVFMENLIMNPKPNQYVQHLDGDTLNNQKHNLKICRLDS